MISALGKDIVFTQLSMKEKKSILGQFLFIAIALIIPTITHVLGINYLVSQPMHWMVIFGGLTYGMISGTILGFVIPILSFLLTGMPVSQALPLMIPELMIYGLISGLLKKKFTSFGSVFVALILGKIIYLLMAVILKRIHVPLGSFVVRTWGPGLITMIVQIALIPALSGLYINWIKKD